MTMYFRPIGPFFPPMGKDVLLYSHNSQEYCIGKCEGVHKSSPLDRPEEDFSSQEEYDDFLESPYCDTVTLINRIWKRDNGQTFEPTHFAILEPPDTIAIYG